VHPRGRPRPARFERDDAIGRAGEQLTVVRDQQYRLRRLSQLPLEPSFAGDVEVVVGLVEQQHVVGPAQQRLECQPLLLPAPFGPIRALVDPVPSRNVTPSSSGLPSGSVSATAAASMYPMSGPSARTRFSASPSGSQARDAASIGDESAAAEVASCSFSVALQTVFNFRFTQQVNPDSC
jgi:hypothetical protein